MSIIFRCAASLHTVFLFLVFIYNLKVTLGQICFAYCKLSSRTDNGGLPPTVIFHFQFSTCNLKATLGQICFAYRKLSSRTGRSDTLPATRRYLRVFIHCLNVSITYHASSSVRVEFIGRVSWFLCILYAFG